jgi:hypothetical protein
VEAARDICPVLGEYYRFDPTPFAEAAWREVKRSASTSSPTRTGARPASSGTATSSSRIMFSDAAIVNVDLFNRENYQS